MWLSGKNIGKYRHHSPCLSLSCGVYPTLDSQIGDLVVQGFSQIKYYLFLSCKESKNSELKEQKLQLQSVIGKNVTCYKINVRGIIFLIQDETETGTTSTLTLKKEKVVAGTYTCTITSSGKTYIRTFILTLTGWFIN